MLFTRYFLTEGIETTDEWKASVARPEAFAAFRDGVRKRFDDFGKVHKPNEAVTEQELIRPVLELLGWTDYLPQQGAARNEDIPDHLLFADAGSKARAVAKRTPEDRFRDAAIVEESKRFGLPLDDRHSGESRTPHGQILRYLSTAEVASDSRIRWGILTNGGVWRLYDYRSRPRASGYYEADLRALLEPGNEDGLRVFQLLFGRDSFILQKGAKTTFLETALAEGRLYEEQVAQDLSGVVFERVFPSLIEALAEETGESLTKIREASLVFLYRLLFVLYAEDRGLLPVNDARYDDYGLRKRVRDDIAHRMAEGAAFSAVATNYHDRLATLFKLVDKGDTSIGLPAYNGGLFGSVAAPLLEKARLADAKIAPIIYDLSHAKNLQGERRFVNYREMSVQQLGSIYERLLEREPVRGGDGKIVVRLNPYARKDSGSFFTPQELVDLIVDRTLKPLAEERLKAFEDKAAELKSDRRSRAQRKADLLKLDPAEAVLKLKVLDPAMGSGHFLVTAVDFLSDYIAELIEYVSTVPAWLDGDYVSPLVKRVATIRREILQRAKDSDWVLDEAQLTDQAIIRRMVLKRCIYGVDKNALTVELAKVSLWLHSFTVGAPLSFLDHHLRCGDSLVGLRVSQAVQDLVQLGGLFTGSAIAAAEAATEGMQLIEEMSDADVVEVHESAQLFHGVEETTADLRGLLDFLCGTRWLRAGWKKKELAESAGALITVLSRQRASAYELLARGPGEMDNSSQEATEDAWLRFAEFWREVRTVADREGFLHWEVAFPGVWRHWQNSRPEGGFDAVIGNPPWDRIKLQEVEWLGPRAPELALAPTAATRKAGIESLRSHGSSLVPEFDAAKVRSEHLSRMVRSCGDYPWLARGDMNLYPLFVERAMGLIRPHGIVGLLVPSGICGDKTAAPFFRFVSTNGRVGSMFDFENRRRGTGLPPFFPDVDSRLKFCALTVGGEERRFDRTECAFFLEDTKAVYDEDRCFSLTPADFARVNPNTSTAPVFRNRRDADVTCRVYERHPVLVDRSGSGQSRAWQVRYKRMFDMTNDSHVFRTVEQLETEGFYPVASNRWKRGGELYLPLYEGKMVQAYDHRAASVVLNPRNLNRPAQPRYATNEEHARPDWLPAPQFWVSIEAAHWPQELGWAVAFKDATSPTNSRTMIASVVPRSGVGNTLPLLMPDDDGMDAYRESAWLLIACLNSLALDFIARQKVQGQHLNWFIVEQLPVLTVADYRRCFGNKTARDIVREHVLRLTYTAHDMAPFAHDLGYDGPPFIWDQEERRHLRARLDALHFHLYGLTEEDAEYVLNNFPTVRRKDQAAFGRYRTRELTLAYMKALAAGDTETDVAV